MSYLDQLAERIAQRKSQGRGQGQSRAQSEATQVPVPDSPQLPVHEI